MKNETYQMSRYRVAPEEAPTLAIKSWKGRRLVYRVTLAVSDTEDHLFLYGIRVRRDGVSFGNEVSIMTIREVESL